MTPHDLPDRIAACVERWSLRLGDPYSDASVSVVFRATLADGAPAALKLQFPHRECEHETEALRRWNGKGAVRLYDWDPERHALLMERCDPGDHLSSVDADEAMDAFADLLPQLWVDAGAPFTSLQDEAAIWQAEMPVSWERAGRPYERELLDGALEAIDRLAGTQERQVLLHQDLHGDNVLRASREPWLVIDPKPLVGEPAFSLAPIVRSYEFGHSQEKAIGRLDRLSAALHLDRERARLWTIVQALAWAAGDGEVLHRHIETARWLWRA